METFGDKIKNIRIKENLKQSELADMLFVSEKTISKTFADFRIFHRGKEIAKGDSCWYLLDMNTKRPVKTKEILKPFEVCDEKVFGEREKVIYKTEGEKIAESVEDAYDDNECRGDCFNQTLDYIIDQYIEQDA